MYKIIGADQKEYGPVTVEQLRQWITEGRVSLQTMVLPEGATEWKPVGELPEFAAVSPVITPTLPNAPEPSLAAAAVNGPAIGLIVTASLGVVVQAIALIKHVITQSVVLTNSEVPAVVKLFSGPLGLATNVLGIVVAVVIFMGALKMRKLESYSLAVAASIIAMIPCFSPCCLLGLPIGIWALVVLNKPEVKSAFH